jgi:LDH2 family malate/lactate/ureidoglycolate dehydrogenase
MLRLSHGSRKEMLLPGEKEAIKRKESLREGILYTSKQIQRLEKAGREVGITEITR